MLNLSICDGHNRFPIQLNIQNLAMITSVQFKFNQISSFLATYFFIFPYGPMLKPCATT